LENRKKYGLILLAVGLVFILLNLIVIYPYITCTFAPLTFWFIAIIGVVGGLLLYYDVKFFGSYEE
jgi:hypothetical protein